MLITKRKNNVIESLANIIKESSSCDTFSRHVDGFGGRRAKCSEILMDVSPNGSSWLLEKGIELATFIGGAVILLWKVATMALAVGPNWKLSNWKIKLRNNQWRSVIQLRSKTFGTSRI